MKLSRIVSKEQKIELEIQMFFELCDKIATLNEIVCAWQPTVVIR